jgi:Coenzyme PQQ synthesis protein D (PqqD)
MPVLSLDTVLVRNPRLSWRVLEDEAVILYPEEGTLHRLNVTGTQVWEQLDGTTPLSLIAKSLTTEFEVTIEDAERDLRTLAAELFEAKLVEVQR